MASSGPTPQPGWYADPQSPDRQRYWDGVNWTASTRPAPGPAAQAPAGQWQAPAGQGQAPGAQGQAPGAQGQGPGAQGWWPAQDQGQGPSGQGQGQAPGAQGQAWGQGQGQAWAPQGQGPGQGQAWAPQGQAWAPQGPVQPQRGGAVTSMWPPRPGENPDDALVRAFSQYERTSGWVWLALGIIQVICLITIIAGVWNIYVGINRGKLAERVQRRDPSIPATVEPLTNYVIAGVLNFVLGGILGVAMVGADLYVRDQILKERGLFEAGIVPAAAYGPTPPGYAPGYAPGTPGYGPAAPGTPATPGYGAAAPGYPPAYPAPGGAGTPGTPLYSPGAPTTPPAADDAASPFRPPLNDD
jgi:hypothetical protein